MKFERALAEGEGLMPLGWRLHNLEFERRSGPVAERVALRRGKALALGRVELPEAQARARLRERGYGRQFRLLHKGLWGAERLLRTPRTARAFARRFSGWDLSALEFQYGRDLRVLGVDARLHCGFCWFPEAGASWWAGLHLDKTRRRLDVRSLVEAVRAYGFNGSARLHPMERAIWFPIHSAPARPPVLSFARRFLEFSAGLP